MDWKKLFWDVPNDFGELQARVKRLNLLFYIMLFALVLIYFGTAQVENEIDRCWDELEVYKINDVYGGFSDNSCFTADGYVLCDLGNFTLLDNDIIPITS